VVPSPLRHLAALPLILAACTTFNDVTVPDAGSTDAGEGGDGGTLPSGYLDLQDAARLCRWVMDCPRLSISIATSIAVHLSPTSFSACVAWAAGPLPPSHLGADVQRALLGGIAAAESCDDALSRTFIEVLGPASPACAGAPGKSCETSTAALDCTLGLRYRCDSPVFAPGSSCLTSDTDARCASQTCAPGTPAACDDDVWRNCDQGLSSSLQCETHGLACSETFCQPNKGTDNECLADGAGTSKCEDALALVCDGLVPSPFDCGELPEGTCVVEQGEARCAPQGASCSPFDSDQSTCDGDRIGVCVYGKKHTVDCAALELSCVGADSLRTARCAGR
jgi:hypothetical protein